MKKVRVIKVMPFVEVGSEWNISHDAGYIKDDSADIYDGLCPSKLIQDGYLEWVKKPRSLEKLFLERLRKDGNIGIELLADLVDIARNHFRDN